MNKKESIKHILVKLNEFNRPLNLTDLMCNIFPGMGMAFSDFHELLDEMAGKGWLNKKETPSSGFEFNGTYYPTKEVTYVISIEGVDYLASLNPLRATLSWFKNNTKISIGGSIAGVTGLLALGIALFKNDLPAQSGDSLTKETAVTNPDSTSLANSTRDNQPLSAGKDSSYFIPAQQKD